MSNSGLIQLSSGVRAFFALPHVAKYFAERGVNVPLVGTTGWKQREQQLNVYTPPAGSPKGALYLRILFLPGDEEGNEGTFSEPRRTGGAASLLPAPGSVPNPQPSGAPAPVGTRSAQPRTLAKWNRVVTASCWAADTRDLANEELQIAVSDNLLEMARQALQWWASADVVESGKPLRRPKIMSQNMGYGREVLYEFIHREPIFDLAVPVLQAGNPNVVRSPAA